VVDRLWDSGLYVTARLVREGATGSTLRSVSGRLVRLIAFLGTCHGARLREVGRPERSGPAAAHEWEPRQRMHLGPVEQWSPFPVPPRRRIGVVGQGGAV
jgi:hypothetical protein